MSLRRADGRTGGAPSSRRGSHAVPGSGDAEPWGTGDRCARRGHRRSPGQAQGRQTKPSPAADLRSCHVTLPQSYQSMTSAWEGAAGLPPKYCLGFKRLPLAVLPLLLSCLPPPWIPPSHGRASPRLCRGHGEQADVRGGFWCPRNDVLMVCARWQAWCWWVKLVVLGTSAAAGRSASPAPLCWCCVSAQRDGGSLRGMRDHSAPVPILLIPGQSRERLLARLFPGKLGEMVPHAIGVRW